MDEGPSAVFALAAEKALEKGRQVLVGFGVACLEMLVPGVVAEPKEVGAEVS